MRDAEERIRHAITAAQLYYYHRLTTEQIAEEMAVSRPKVSRLLSFARERGLVEIKIHDREKDLAPLSSEIERRYGVNRVHPVPVPEILGELTWLERVAQFTAQYLNQILAPEEVLGCAWGTTLSAICSQLVPKPVSGLKVVQLNGSGNTHTYDNNYAAHILKAFGENFGAGVYLFPVPTFFDFAETKRAMWREQSVRNILKLQEEANVLLYSIGSVNSGVPSHVYSSEYLSQRDLELLRAEGVVGDLATVFYRADGSYEDIEINERSSGPPLSLYKQVTRAICVVSGRSKVPGLHAALQAGYIGELIVDEPTARTLINFADGNAGSTASA
ncbi:MAG: sugar-binding transcriptional regulator [Spirochaetales bacterium]